MNALDGVLADLVEADRDCAYVTVKREPLEELIADWAGRGDRLALFCGLLTRARNELAQASGGRRDEQLPPSFWQRVSGIHDWRAGRDHNRILLGHCPSPACHKA